MREPKFYRMTGYDRSLLPNPHLVDLDEGIEGPDDWIPQSGYSLGYPGWGLLYYTTLCRLRPDAFNLVIETGTNVGASAIVLAQAIKDSPGTGILRTVEIDGDAHRTAVENVAKAGLSGYVELRLGDSHEELPAMVAGDALVQVAFLDGNHLHDHVVKEFELLAPYLAPQGVVIFDNTYRIAEAHEDQRVHGAVQTIVSRFGGNLVNLPYCSWYTPGMAVWQQEPFPGEDDLSGDAA